MAERAANTVTSAVTGELTSRVFSGLIQRYAEHGAAAEKLQQLEMLLIKIHSAVEASERRAIENSWLLRWRDKLKEAAKQGDAVLASFQQRVKDAQATSHTDGNRQQGETASSSAVAPVRAGGVLSFTRNSLSAMVQGIGRARRMMFASSDDGMERLNETLRGLEKLSPDIGEFIRLLHLEALPKVDLTPCSTALSAQVHGPTDTLGETREKKRMKQSATHSNPSTPEEEKTEEMPDVWYEELVVDNDDDLLCDSEDLWKDHFFVPQDRLEIGLEATLIEICKAVELADGHDLGDLQWLAYWAAILKEAKEQGCDILSTTSTRNSINAKDNMESMVECDQDKDELGTFVHRLESLARDVEYFSKLVYLCPAC